MASAPSSALTHASCSNLPRWTHRRPHGPPGPIPSSTVSPPSPRSLFLPLGVIASSAPASSFRSSTFTRADGVSTGAGCRRGRTDAGSRKMLQNMGILKASSSGISPSDGGDGISDTFEGWEIETSSQGTSFLAKLAIALGIAATITVMSIYFKWPMPGSSFGFPFSSEGSAPLVSSASPVGFTFSILGYKVVLPEYTPGWVYFWLLMAAGCGLFISEEALNVWVGISLARTLSPDGTWKSFVHSFSNNVPYIISTVLWVYCGTFFCWSAKSNIFPGWRMGYIIRMLFRWCLLRWPHYSSNSAGDRFLTERKTNDGPCWCCDCCGRLDCVSIRTCSFCSVSYMPAPACLKLVKQVMATRRLIDLVIPPSFKWSKFVVATPVDSACGLISNGKEKEKC